LQEKTIGAEIEKVEGGYDHNFILNEISSSEIKHAAVVKDPLSKREMHVYTDQPGIQFYSGNYLDGTLEGVHGRYQKHAAMCLETQHWPDSPNQPKFPSVVLEPTEKFHSVTVYKFAVSN